MRHGIWEYTVPKGVKWIEVNWACKIFLGITEANDFIWSYSGNASGSWNLNQGMCGGTLLEPTWFGRQSLENVNGGETLKIEAEYSKKNLYDLEHNTTKIWCECGVSFYYY